MNAMTCELCGSNEIVKQDGLYVCQHCGTKYSVDDAKKLLGTVKIDKSDELDNLYILARRARDNGDAENASKFYNMVLQQDPKCWEPVFFTAYFHAVECKLKDLETAIAQMSANLQNVIPAISQLSEEKRIDAAAEVANSTIRFATLADSASRDIFIETATDSPMWTATAQRYVGQHDALLKLTLFTGNAIEKNFGNKEEFTRLAVLLWKKHINIMVETYNADLKKSIATKDMTESARKVIDEACERIQKYEPEYRPPYIEEPPAKGCYIATCVYGSYDCSQVWTLRRFRDDQLGKSVLGQVFIRAYYAISPRLVKWFGNCKWFKCFWKTQLDRLVSKLQSEGVEATPYEDQ